MSLEKDYAISELATRAIVWALKKFSCIPIRSPVHSADRPRCLFIATSYANALKRRAVDYPLVSSVSGEEDPDKETEEPIKFCVGTFATSDKTHQKLDELYQFQQTCPDLEAMFMYLSEKVLPKDVLIASPLKVTIKTVNY